MKTLLVCFVGLLLILESFNCFLIDSWKIWGKLFPTYIVQTECGKVEGKSFSETTDRGKQKKVYEFRNIPYAVPPVGHLRWRPPVRLSKDPSKCWNNTLKYDDKNLVVCKQIYPHDATLKSTEDCLVLTVRTPTLKKNAKLPVLVWIHGGAMVYGYNEWFGYYPDREFTASMDIVTVSINYRLNIFGFLSMEQLWIRSGPNESYGNYGIMDQILALKWVRDNIGNFGGDPEKVTVLGESGGGTAVYGLIASPLTKGLFQKASPLSGAPNYRVTHTIANQIFQAVIFSKSPCGKYPKDMQARCLQSIPADVLLAAGRGTKSTTKSSKPPSSPLLTYHWQFPANTPYVGLPLEIIDPVVVPYSPDQIPTNRGDSLDILIGNSAQEIGPGAPGATPNITDFKSMEAEMKPKLDTFKKDVYSFMLSLYTGSCGRGINMPKKPDAMYLYTTMTSDAVVLCSTNAVAKHLAKLPGNSVYRYVISQPDSKKLGFGKHSAFHSWGTHLLFGLKEFKGEKLPATDKMLMLDIRKFYRGFIKSYRWFVAFQNQTIEFARNNEVRLLSEYHKQQCKAWEIIGELNHSWGDLGL